MIPHVGRLSVAALLSALAVGGFAAPAGATPTGAGAAGPQPPALLPGAAQAASAGIDSKTWIVGATRAPATTAIARRYDARQLGEGSWLVTRDDARAFAAALERAGTLRYSEPNRTLHRRQGVTPDPLSPQARWRDFVADPDLTPPPVSDASPLLALVDSPLDASHPEFANSRVTTVGTLKVTDFHGTATAAVAAAPQNGVGMLGVWPGMRATNFTLPPQIGCADSAATLRQAVQAGAAVINMSYGSAQLCFAEYEQLQMATRKGITLVAAAGNEFADGNPLEYPASLPHVLTVAAVGPDDKPSFFSNANAAIDLSAPGEGILTAVPPAFDADGNADGYQAVSGTSFAAPMVAATAAWVRQSRPELSPDQVSQVVRLGARDIGRRGWDPQTGFGVLSVKGALERKAPPADVGEPNDDIYWVDGRAFGRAEPRLWQGRGTARRFGLLDRYEDPVDVFRVRIPGRTAARITVSPRGGDPDVAVVSGDVERLFRSPLLARSRREGRVKDSVVYRNTARAARSVYVVTYVHAGGRSLDAAYDLTVRRAR